MNVNKKFWRAVLAFYTKRETLAQIHNRAKKAVTFWDFYFEKFQKLLANFRQIWQ